MDIPEEAVEAVARTTWEIQRQEINAQMVERGEHVRLEAWEDVPNKEPRRHQARKSLEAACGFLTARALYDSVAEVDKLLSLEGPGAEYKSGLLTARCVILDAARRQDER